MASGHRIADEGEREVRGAQRSRASQTFTAYTGSVQLRKSRTVSPTRTCSIQAASLDLGQRLGTKVTTSATSSVSGGGPPIE